MAQIPLDHAMTVALLGRFDAFEAELETLLNDPRIGRQDLKSEIRAGLPLCLSGGIVKTDDVPDDPVEQILWVGQQMLQARFAKVQILRDHAETCPIDLTTPEMVISAECGHA